MIKDYIDRIEAICIKLKYSVTNIDVLNWLENFKQEDWDKALTVLSKLEYFTINEIVRAYELGLNDILKISDEIDKRFMISEIVNCLQSRRFISLRKSESSIILHPIEELGKSGTTMIYFVKQTQVYQNNESKIKIFGNLDKLKSVIKDNCHFILVDDFLGTGETVVDYYKNEIRPEITRRKVKNFNLYILTIIYTEKAKELLAEFPEIKIIGSFRKPIFCQTGSVFGYRPRMIEMRHFCYEYGKDLFSKQDYKKKKIISFPLGYGNTQSLVAFAHTTPNNTLPIIWSSKKKWHPIFPRKGFGRLEEAKRLKDDTRRWLSIFKESGLNDLCENGKNLYNSQNLQMLLILRLKKQNKNEFDICQNLGLNMQDYNEILENGKSKNIFTDNGMISEFGNNVYSEIQKKISIIKSRKEDFEFNKNEDMVYVPTKFRGIS
ncbi:MAG: hypothetical protein RBR95_11325 [Ignavibacteriaceae bacterium]|jgi:hypothetical protein|nr:hypothetical protein [Ignavibacteriaceae bacterium]